MTLRNDGEIRQSFNVTTWGLDAALRRVSELWGVAIDDHSNRSGFDHSGFPHYTWSHVVRREGERDGCIVLTQVHLSYLEPGEAREAAPVECTVNAQVFLLGSLPFFTRAEKREEPVAQLAGDGMRDLVRTLLAEAAEWLPERYRIAVDISSHC